MMRKTIYTIALTLIFMGMYSCSKSPGDVLTKNIEARGGAQVVNNVKQVSFDAKLSKGGMDMLMKVYMEHPDKMRIDLTFNGQTATTAYTGDEGWLVNGTNLQELKGKRLNDNQKMMKLQFFYFLPELLKADNKEIKCEYEGSEKVAGTDCIKLKYTMKDGDEIIKYIDSKNFTDVKMDTKLTLSGQKVDTEILYSNFQKINGYLVPMTMEIRTKGSVDTKMLLTNVKVNEAIDNSVFKAPNI